MHGGQGPDNFLAGIGGLSDYYTSAKRGFGSGKISDEALALAKTLKISQVPAGVNKDALQTRYNTWLESTPIKKRSLPQSWYEGFTFSKTAAQLGKSLWPRK